MKPAIHVPPTVEELKSRFNYDPETGVVTNNVPASRNVKQGSVVGCYDSKGYLIIRINWRLYKLHLVIWKLYYGDWATQQIDHINGIRSDNRISNLRLATGSQNNYNSAVRSDNTSGYKGVSWHKRDKKWHARVNNICLGAFYVKEDAIAARNAAAKEKHRDFYCVGDRKTTAGNLPDASHLP